MRHEESVLLPYETRARIEALLSDFAWYADRGDGGQLAQLFHPDGTLRLGADEMSGRQQIDQDCRRRTVARRTRHVWSNLRIVAASASLIETAMVQLTIEQRESPEGSAQEARVNDVRDTFRPAEDGRWLFASRWIDRAIKLSL